MMRIIDTNALSYLKEAGLVLDESLRCYVPDEIYLEFVGDSGGDAWMSKNKFINLDMDFSLFLTQYAAALNSYPHVSFYAVKGLGDVAIVATILCMKTGGLKNASLFVEPIELITRDRDLTDYVNKNFPDVSVKSPENFAALIKSVR